MGRDEWKKMDTKFAGTSITGMLSWIPQATKSFFEKLTSSRTINGLVQKMRRNIIKLCVRMHNDCISIIMLMNATLGAPRNSSAMK